MAVIYVDSGATGANDGTTPTDAYTVIASAVTNAVSGDIVYTSHTHSQVTGTNLVQNWADGVIIISSDFGNIVNSFPVPRTGATLENTGTADMTNKGATYMSGFTLTSNDHMDLGCTNQNTKCIYENCTITMGDDGTLTAQENTVATYINCPIDITINDSIFVGRNHLEIVGGSLTRTAGANGLFSFDATSEGCTIHIRGCDMTGVPAATPFISGTTTSLGLRKFIMTQCKINSSQDLGDGNLLELGIMQLNACDRGNLTDAAFQLETYDFYGESVSTTARYRTGGADDGEQANAYSQEVTALANNTVKGIYSTSFLVSTYVSDADSTARTFKVHVAHNAVGSGTAGALQDDEMWLELVGPDDNVTPTSLGHFATSVSVTDQASDLTTESGETWNGTNVGTKQSASLSYSPSINGLVQIRVHFASGSASDVVVNVDPKIEVS